VRQKEIAMPNAGRIVTPKTHDVGGLMVGRVLPQIAQRSVGPFVFLDHMGPAEMKAGQALDVRPHPHIGLSTLTYLFEGGIFHRDTLGSAVEILPGEVNWMTAGRGIAHSERTSPAARLGPHRLHGLQFWVALPKADEETAPSFEHYDAPSIPHLSDRGVDMRVAAGRAYGAQSPVKTYSPLFFVDMRLEAGAKLALPNDYTDRAAYLIEGTIDAGGPIEPRNMILFEKGADAVIEARTSAHIVLLGGEPFPEPRHIWWNFVSSSQERMEQAKKDWKDGRFGLIPGDDKEFIPLPE
jgi:redox-sensitive bicupin YhaK (pirin superfamily)